MELNTKNHWDTIYNTKQSNEVSWTQDVPTVCRQRKWTTPVVILTICEIAQY